MEDSSEIVTLGAFNKFLWLLRAYDGDNFRQTNRFQLAKNIGYTFLVSLFIALVPILDVLGIWFLIDTNATLGALALAIPHILNISQQSIQIVTLIGKKRKAYDTMDRLQAVIERQCNSSEQSYHIYKHIERRHESATNLFIKMTAAILFMISGSAAMFPISHAIFGYPSPDLWILTIETHSLLGRKTYFGYAADWFLETISIGSCFVCFVAVVSLYIGLCLYINGMVLDMKTRMKYSSFGRWSIYVENIEFHNDIIDLAKEVNNVMKLILFTMAFISTIVLALSLFVVELYGVSVETVFASNAISFVLLVMFNYCHFAECLTTDMLEVGDIFYELEWYRLPAKQQRLLVLPIGRARREFRLSGLGLFDCSLSVYSAIVRRASSYFLILRSFK